MRKSKGKKTDVFYRKKKKINKKKIVELKNFLFVDDFC